MRALLAVLLVLAASGCAAAAPTCAPPTWQHDVGTVAGWVGYLAAHRDDVALVADDGRGTRVEHRADDIEPMASAGKALNMAAYGRAVALGQVHPDEPVRMGEWERWSVAGTEEAHAQALDSLRIPRAGMRAADPGRTVTLDQVATVMNIYSDDAAPDYLRARLGDQALRDTARAAGWPDAELPSTTGFLLSGYVPELVPLALDRPARRAAEWDLARRYATDPAFRADADRRPGPSAEEDARRSDGGPGGTARGLAELWSAMARDAFPGAAIARAIGEQRRDPYPGIAAIGVKGGSLSGGVLTRGIEMRRTDGTVAVVVLLVRRMPRPDWDVGANGTAFNDLIERVPREPETMAALRCAVGA